MASGPSMDKAQLGGGGKGRSLRRLGCAWQGWRRCLPASACVECKGWCLFIGEPAKRAVAGDVRFRRGPSFHRASMALGCRPIYYFDRASPLLLVLLVCSSSGRKNIFMDEATGCVSNHWRTQEIDAMLLGVAAWDFESYTWSLLGEGSLHLGGHGSGCRVLRGT